MSTYKFCRLERLFDHEFTSPIEQVIGFKNFRVFLYYENGNYFLDDIQEEDDIVAQGKIEPFISEMLPLNSTNLVAYIDRENCKLKVFDVDKQSIVEEFTRNLPTQSALGAASVEIEKKQKIFEQIEFETLPGSERVVYLEKNQDGSQQILTVFDRNSQNFFKQFSFPVDNQVWKISAINNTNLIAIWHSVLNKSEIKLKIWDIDAQERPQEINIGATFGGSLVQVRAWGVGKVALLYNPDEPPIPNIFIYDYQNQKEEKLSLNTTGITSWPSANSLLQECYDTNMAEKTLLLKGRASDQRVYVYNIAQGQVIDSLVEDKDSAVTVSVDRTYFISYPQIYESREFEHYPSITKYDVYTLMDNRSMYLYLLEDSELLEKYGTQICKSVLQVLCSQP